MTTERYPARVVSLKAEIPKKPGYYWWKEDIDSDLEIAQVDEDGEVYFCGNEVPLSVGIGTYWSDIGLFGHEVVGPHTVTEDDHTVRPLTTDEVDQIRKITGIPIKQDEYMMHLIIGAAYKETQNEGEVPNAL